MIANKRKEINDSLKQLLIDQLRDIYWAEKAMTKELPHVMKKITHDQLLKVVEAHLWETQGHAERLEHIFRLLGMSISGKKCVAMSGIIEEAELTITDHEDSATRDAAIILSLQKMEHYEISTYGALCAFANQLELVEIGKLLKQTLEEERKADKILTSLAECDINEDALAEVDIQEHKE